MTNLQDLTNKTSEDVAQTILLEVVQKITIEDGDILVVRVDDDEIFQQFYTILSEQHKGKKIMLVNENNLKILREVDEEEMAEYGWVKAKEV